jgi:uncharacterized protein (DUF2237 family)
VLDRPVTGFYRDGCCATGPEDVGSHTVCSIMTAEFLDFSRRAGNDLSTPRPEYGFPLARAGRRVVRLCVPVARGRARRVRPARRPRGDPRPAVDVVPIEALIAHAAQPGLVDGP